MNCTQLTAATKISAIIPVYNNAIFLKHAVYSLLQTKYNNLEIIIVDDGSIDNSLSLAKSIANQHKNIIVASHKNGINKGSGATRNFGVTLSTGDYVCFLDADDYVLPNRFSKCVKILDENPDVDAVCETTERIVEPGGEWRAEHVRPLTMFTCDNPDEVLHLRISGQLEWSTNAILIRRDSFDSVGGFEESLGLAQDAALWLKLACKCTIVGGSRLPVCVYRLHNTNSSHKLYSQPFAVSTQVLVSVLAWARESNIEKEKIESLAIGLEEKLFYECAKLRSQGAYKPCIFALLRSALTLPRLLARRRFWSNFILVTFDSVWNSHNR